MKDIKPDTTLDAKSIMAGLRLKLPPELALLRSEDPPEIERAAGPACLAGPTGIGTTAVPITNS